MLCSTELSSKQTVINHIKKIHQIESVSDNLFCVAQLEIRDKSGASAATGGNLHSGGVVDTGGRLNTVRELNVVSDCEENTSCQVNTAVSEASAGDNVDTVSHGSAGDHLSSGVTKGCVITKSTKKQKKPHGFLQNLMNILDDPDKMEEIKSIKQKNKEKSEMPSHVSSSSLPRQPGCSTSGRHLGHPTNAIKLPASGVGNIQLHQTASQTPGPR